MPTIKRKVTRFLVLISVFLLPFIILVAPANANEELVHVPGIAEGTGKHFEITDSEYLNITLESAEEITARIESMPEMVILEISALAGASSSDIKLSGFSPNTTYHKYEDDYHNYAPLITDENGAVYFNQDISQPHIIFIQPRKSTKFIKDDAAGGDCEDIGSWSSSSKTCTLNQDVNGTIQIDNDNITLDGAGHSLIGTGSSAGVHTIKFNVNVKNLNISGFSTAVSYYQASGKIENLFIENNYHGIVLNDSSSVEVIRNTIKSNEMIGIKLNYANYNTISENIIGPGNYEGIMQSSGGNRVAGNNTYVNNQITGNKEYGIAIGSSINDTLIENKIESNSYYGIYIIRNEKTTFKNNSMSGNRNNFYLGTGTDLAGHDIDNSNTVNGRIMYYIKNAASKVFNNSSNIGAFYCVNCDNITFQNVTIIDESQIVFWHTNNSLIEGIKSSNIYFSDASGNTVRKNDLGKIRIEYYKGHSDNNKIYNNNFSDIYTPAYSCSPPTCNGNVFYLDPPMGGNYWKANEGFCKDTNNNGFCDLAYYFPQNFRDKYPWVKEFDFSQPSCCSSVMFLPGHQGSRLYKKDGGDEDQLWEPTNRNEDVRQLYLNSDGESADPEIYTREIVDEIYGIGDNIYKGFIDSMDNFAGEGVINEWKPIPYDWRLPLEKIAEEGVKLEDGGHMDIIEEIKEMAAESKTGKVTLIGHSNGGLLAKTLIEHLKDEGEENLVDKLIMVGTPQLGTPKAAAGLLHGDEINLLHSLILDKKTARGFAENMVSAYNLLPSKKYFDFVQSPVVEFDEDVKEIYDFRSLYEENIDSWNEFKKFLLGDDGGRADPEFEDTDSPNVLRENLLSRSEETHNNLDDWQAPENMEVIQIAGWGLDTIRGIKYDDCDIPFCPDKLSNLDRSLILTEDGDKTVVVPSAVEMGGEAERYYLNIEEYNEKEETNKQHANILEIEPLQNFIKNIIQNSNTLTDYISAEKPEVSDEDKRLRFTLHSPVAIDLYDNNGRHTGLMKGDDSGMRYREEQIPNSYYIEFGEKKYAGMDGAFDADIVLTGEDLGSFTFEIDEVFGTGETKTTAFVNIPVAPGMEAALSVTDEAGELKIDVDADGKVDLAVQPGEGISKSTSLEILGKVIGSLDIHESVKNRLIRKTDNVRRQLEKEHLEAVAPMLDNLIHQAETFSRDKTNEKLRIPEEMAEKLIMILEKIKAME